MGLRVGPLPRSWDTVQIVDPTTSETISRQAGWDLRHWRPPQRTMWKCMCDGCGAPLQRNDLQCSYCLRATMVQAEPGVPALSPDAAWLEGLARAHGLIDPPAPWETAPMKRPPKERDDWR